MCWCNHKYEFRMLQEPREVCVNQFLKVMSILKDEEELARRKGWGWEVCQMDRT